MSLPSGLKDRSFLVTGAAGCIGAWVVKLLFEVGARPVVYDLIENRARLNLIMDEADSVTWEIGDITDFETLRAVCQTHRIDSVIHLAALQVPFCRADPIGSARVNVLGMANILELARQAEITRLSYASSIAAPAMTDSKSLATLYGAHKVCAEQMAAVYWQDWNVPSVGIRPTIVYGPARDQGMSAAPSIAMLAAEVGETYNIPFSGLVSYSHAEDVAIRFILATEKSAGGASIFDLNGSVADVPEIIDLIKEIRPAANLSFSGDAMPFPAEPSDNLLETFLGIEPCRTMEQGVNDTFECFARAHRRGVDLISQFKHIKSKAA